MAGAVAPIQRRCLHDIKDLHSLNNMPKDHVLSIQPWARCLTGHVP